MRITILPVAFALLALSPIAGAGELAIGVGKSFRAAEGFTGGVVSLAWRTPKWEARILYVGAQTIYPQYGGLELKSYIAVVVSRQWIFRQGRNFQPELGVGALFKEDARCKFDGDIKCDRRTPLWFAFCPHVGVSLASSDLRLTLWHCSNDALDAGHKESKNLGEEILLPELVIWRTAP